MSFTLSEKARIRYHMGYAGTAMAPSLSAGVPIPLQTMFLLESALNMVLPDAEEIVRVLVSRLDQTDEAIFQCQIRMQAESVDGIKLRANEADSLEREYLRQAARLSDVLHVPLYPFSARFANINSLVPGIQTGMIGVS